MARGCVLAVNLHCQTRPSVVVCDSARCSCAPLLPLALLLLLLLLLCGVLSIAAALFIATVCIIAVRPSRLPHKEVPVLLTLLLCWGRSC